MKIQFLIRIWLIIFVFFLYFNVEIDQTNCAILQKLNKKYRKTRSCKTDHGYSSILYKRLVHVNTNLSTIQKYQYNLMTRNKNLFYSCNIKQPYLDFITHQKFFYSKENLFFCQRIIKNHMLRHLYQSIKIIIKKNFSNLIVTGRFNKYIVSHRINI